MSERPAFSVVIPCRDDVAALARLLPQLAASRDIEIVVVCPADDRAIAELCAHSGARMLTIDAPRGLRLKNAAREARAPNLWFVHADATLAAGAADAVAEAFADGAVGGYFRFRLDGPRTLGKRIVEVGVALRCRLGGIPYGDQAVFVTRRAYDAAGGHEPLPLFDEFRLLARLKRDRGFRPLSMAVGVDPQRWERGGYLRQVIKNRCMSIAYALGVSPQRLARWYYE